MKSNTLSPNPDDASTLANEMPLRLSMNNIKISGEAKQALLQAGQISVALIRRHSLGDWGEIIGSQRAKMHASDYDGEFISSYRLQNGASIWITTTQDCSLTTVDVKPKDKEHLLLIKLPCERLFVLEHRHCPPNGNLSSNLMGVAPSLAVAIQRQPEHFSQWDSFFVTEFDDDGDAINEPVEI